MDEVKAFEREVELYAIMQRVSDSGYLLEAGKSLDRAIADGKVETVKNMIERLVVNLEIFLSTKNQKFLKDIEEQTQA